MTREFKSNAGALFRHFVTVLIVAVLVLFFVVGGGGVLLKLDKNVILNPAVLISCGAFAVIFAFFFAFIRHNITVFITLEGVTLRRGKKAYLTLLGQDHVFGSYIHRYFCPAGVYTSRYLRAFDKDTGKRKDYRIYFSKRRFEELIAIITWLNSRGNEISDEVAPTAGS